VSLTIFKLGTELVIFNEKVMTIIFVDDITFVDEIDTITLSLLRTIRRAQ